MDGRILREPMDHAVVIWKMANDEKYRDGVMKLATLGKKFHFKDAKALLAACESLDPSDIYQMVEDMRPSSYVIAELVILAKKSEKTTAARASAMVRHRENHSMKDEVVQWLDTNMPNFNSMDAAAEAITQQQPITFRTARGWVGEWKKLRSASKP